MKTVLVILAICFVVGTLSETVEEKREKFRQLREKCKSENGIDDAIIQKVKTGEQEHFDQKLKCYSACLFKNVGVMNADGTINEAVARARIATHISNEKAEEIVNQCRVPAEQDHCEVAGKIMQCLVKTKVMPIFQ